jgi:hypothetical protein
LLRPVRCIGCRSRVYRPIWFKPEWVREDLGRRSPIAAKAKRTPLSTSSDDFFIPDYPKM